MTKKEIKQFVKRLVKESMIDDKLDEKKVAIIVDAIDQVPYPYSQMILEEYGRLITIEKQKRTFNVRSAHCLENSTLDEVTRLFKRDMDFVETHIDPELISGITLANGDYVIDLSIKREIENLRQFIA